MVCVSKWERQVDLSASSYPNDSSLVNIIASSPDDYVSIVSLSPSAGFTLSDGLVVPSPILMIDGNCFMWDVGHPTDGTKPDGKPKSEFGLDWDGWSKEKLAVFETLSPRPGELPSPTCVAGLPHDQAKS